MKALKTDYKCSLQLTFDLVGGKWKLVILWCLMEGPRRYSFIKEHTHGITKKVLTEQLRELETMGLIQKSDNEDFPRVVIYSFTEYGKTITPLITHMCDWTNAYANRNGINIISNGEVENK